MRILTILAMLAMFTVRVWGKKTFSGTMEIGAMTANWNDTLPTEEQTVTIANGVRSV
jgi:hypothetical protein